MERRLLVAEACGGLVPCLPVCIDGMCFVQLVIARLLPTQVSIIRCDVKLLDCAEVNLVKTTFTHFGVGKSSLYQS